MELFNEPVNTSNDEAILELADNELAFIGGGIGDTAV